jgi:hypothetical protein
MTAACSCWAHVRERRRLREGGEDVPRLLSGIPALHAAHSQHLLQVERPDLRQTGTQLYSGLSLICCCLHYGSMVDPLLTMRHADIVGVCRHLLQPVCCAAARRGGHPCLAAGTQHLLRPQVGVCMGTSHASVTGDVHDLIRCSNSSSGIWYFPGSLVATIGG